MAADAPHRACEEPKVTEEPDATGDPKMLSRQCGKQGLTPKLSRAAAERKSCGKLYLPHDLRSDAAST
ncbi:hypothetical protein GCM10011394_27710 [Luteimonas terricola]|uniref:Uncharacterized protein n=1 Tax=Luteimonas terricola TaxID=645597 RepID=A0ABQ2EMT7_9GAMM|nr:hypothetical protein GCM10011394_27710 [Luteimonas terricola]